MDLFGSDSSVNWLPCDGTVHYFGRILSPDVEKRYLEVLLRDIPWRNDEVILFGKHIVTARKIAWYADSGVAYTYSGTTKQALSWTGELGELKVIVEQLSGAKFNSCLLNLYHNGNEGMGWHSDDEKSLEKDSCIASVSLGAARKFCFKHKSVAKTAALVLESGSLLVMKDATQTHWLHSLPKSKKVQEPRINLTFRSMVLR